MNRLRTLCFLVLFAMAAAACGGSDGSEAVATSSTDAAEATTPAQDATNSDSDTGDTGATNADNTDSSATPLLQSDSPIENLLGVPVFDDAAMTALFTDLSREAEVAVATCMLAQGFEYAPAIIETGGSASQLATDSLQYAEQRGLGIVVEFNEAEYDPGSTTTNKNVEYVNSLSDGERDAYFVALTGATEDTQLEPGDTRGCAGQAEEEVFSILGLFGAIETDLNRYYELFISDSRILAITSEWQDCMAEAGFLFDNEDELFDHIIVQVDEVMSDEANFGEFDGEALGASGGFFGNGFRPPLVPEAQAQIDAIGEEEIRIAVANWTCREPIKDTEIQVQREYEAQFVDEVRPRVEALQGEG